ANRAKEVGDLVDDLRKDLNFQDELTKVKSSEVVVLRSGKDFTSKVELPDFTDKDKAHPQLFKMEFTASRIKNDVDIAVKVGSRAAFTATRLVKGDLREVFGTPYMFRVESIYHAKLAFDFDVLKVLPKAESTIATTEAK